MALLRKSRFKTPKEFLALASLRSGAEGPLRGKVGL